jgi:hypothetical protein
MVEDITTAIDYFSARQDYFWRWAEHGRVVEFANKKTICYREELNYLFGVMFRGMRFPFGSLLLLICACKDNWESLFEMQQQLKRLSLVPGFIGEEYLQAEQLTKDAYAFLKVVNGLPLGFRSSLYRTTVIRSIIATLPNDEKLPDISAMMKMLNTGEFDEGLVGQQKPFSIEQLKIDLSPLAAALSFFPDTETLDIRIRTGLLTLPPTAPIPLPEAEGPALLSDLDEHHQTRMLAALTRKILAAIRIPMYLSGSSDFALGGVSDIGNRGDFDQLLLSELAQDDLLLTARLANNEALYLKRETPPDNAVEELGVFIDVTLKMWGMPRVLALATALAFREGKTKNQDLKAWGVGAVTTEIDLYSKKGIIAALEQLDPSLHCGEQLVKKLRQQSKNRGKYILITSEGFLQDPVTNAYFQRVKDQLNFLATVNRNGHIQLIRLTKGRQQLLNEARINLDELVYGMGNKAKRQYPQGTPPAIMLQDEFPLYYPTSKVKMDYENTFLTANNRVVIISQDRRVLCWPAKNKGAVELIDSLPHGTYCFAESLADVYLLLTSAKAETMKFYRLDPVKGSADLYELEPRQRSSYTIKFINGQFFMMGGNGLDILDLGTMKFSAGSQHQATLFNSHQRTIQHYKNFNLFKKQINNGYSVINSAKNVWLRSSGHLCVDKRQFKPDGNKFAWTEFKHTGEWIQRLDEQQLQIEYLPFIKFTKFTWSTGSQALLDSRGLLHLKSRDTTVPEICILLVVDQPSACWSADGVVSGSAYFTGKTGVREIQPAVFYEHYIQRFINSIK